MIHFSVDSSHQFPLSRHFCTIPSVQAAPQVLAPEPCSIYTPLLHTLIFLLPSFMCHLESSALGSYRGATARKCPGAPSSWHIRLGVSGLELSSRWTHTEALQELKCLWASRPTDGARMCSLGLAYRAACTSFPTGWPLPYSREQGSEVRTSSHRSARSDNTCTLATWCFMRLAAKVLIGHQLTN